MFLPWLSCFYLHAHYIISSLREHYQYLIGTILYRSKRDGDGYNSSVKIKTEIEID